MVQRNYGFLGFGRKRDDRQRTPFLESGNVTQFVVVVAIGIALLSIIAGVVSIWYKPAENVTKQVGMGLLILIIIVSILVPFMLVRRQFANFTAKEFLFVILAVGMLIFLLVVTPKLFNLPEIFTVSRLELAQITQSLLGFP